MNITNNNDTEDILDIGASLKREKKLKENLEVVEKIKKEAATEKEGSVEQKEQKAPRKWRLLIYILLILLVGSVIRFYVASMPITDSWAETVVEDNLKRQVRNRITTEYPTLSEEKTQELIFQGTKQALAAEQNQDAIKTLSSSYKESYRDQEGNSYLYEIDPYFFYEIAQNKNSTLNREAHNLLSFIERWFHSIVQLILPGISFVEGIFYLPLIFTLFCAIILFFIGKELWNETAGFITALFFVSHPILLEFSILGFVDTNMLNMFFILATGLLFLYIVKIFRIFEQRVKKYCALLFLIVAIIFLIILFRYNWSTWYISILLIASTLTLVLLIFLKNFIFFWKIQTAKRKKMFIAGTLVFFAVSGGILYYGFQKEEDNAKSRIEQKILTTTLKKYLHLKYDDPFGEWPDAFSLIKELQTTDVTVFIEYLGGNLIVLLSIFIFVYLFYKGVRDNNCAYIYFTVAYITFLILSFRAIRILPYFIPFFALSIGISITSIVSSMSKRMIPLIAKEKRIMQFIFIAILYAVFILPVAYTFSVAVQEKSAIMPIMDDAIYNSAIYIKENSEEDAIVSTWWDRGTFYKALANREVHLHSQPHMPRTYWLSTFYMTDNESIAKNTLYLLCDYKEYELYTSLKNMYTSEEAINKIYELLKEETNLKNSMPFSLHCQQATAETYIVVIDDLMQRFSAVQYFAEWNFATMQQDPNYPYTDIDGYDCLRSLAGVYCTIRDRNVFVNFTSLQIKGQAPINEVYVVENNTVQYMQQNTTSTDQWTLIIYERAGYWKALYLPKIVADSMYVRLMFLDGHNLQYFEKVFDEVHAETSWVKVYKVKQVSEDY